MKLAVVGCGRWGKNVIRTIGRLEEPENVRLTDVVHAGDPTRAEWVNNQTDARCHTDLDRALERVRAVCLVTPDETHPGLVEHCLEAGVDVFVEKPLAFDRETARRLLDRAAEEDRLLMPGHLMLFHPFLAHLREDPDFRAETLDSVLVDRFNHLRASGERRLLHSSLIHDLAALDVLFRSGPDAITVHEARGLFPPGRYLSAHLLYGGVDVRVRACIDWPRRHRSMSFRRGDRVFYFDGLEERLEITGGPPDDRTSRNVTFEVLPLTEELRHFVRAVRGETTCRITPEHVMRVMDTMGRIQEEAAEAAEE